MILAIESKRSPEIVKALIKAGANLNARNRRQSPALSAAISNQFEIDVIDEFIKAGADVNKLGTDGTTPLFVALYVKAPETVKALIKGGAEVNAKLISNSKTPLIVASENGVNEAKVELLQRGAELEARDNSMKTPLLAALQSSGFNRTISSTAEILIDAGADINAADYKEILRCFQRLIQKKRSKSV